MIANGLNAETWGAELRASWPGDPLVAPARRVRLLRQAAAASTPAAPIRAAAGMEGNDPRSRFVLRSLIDLPGGFELDGTVRHVARLPAPVVPAYTELDLRLGWQASDRARALSRRPEPAARPAPRIRPAVAAPPGGPAQRLREGDMALLRTRAPAAGGPAPARRAPCAGPDGAGVRRQGGVPLQLHQVRGLACRRRFRTRTA